MTVPASPSPPGRATQLTVVGLTVAVFAAVLAFVTLQLRGGLREQILSGKAETLAAVASMQLANGAEALAEVGLTDAPGELLAAVLKASKYRGVLAIRVFDAGRRFSGALPLELSDEPPSSEEWTARPFARMRPREKLQALAGAPGPASALASDEPLIEAWVPLRRSEGASLAGVAQFWIAGDELAAEFTSLDRRLALQAGIAWLAGAVVIVLVLGWAFRRLAAANHILEARTEDLQRANRELVLTAKTSALGTVTAHLIHEIKNPLAGLEVFMASQAEPGGREESGRELVAATELTRRLRTMINDVVGVLRDEQHGAHFELTCTELAQVTFERVRPAANLAGVRLVADIVAEASLPGRRANLTGLVLRNLLQNAVEASPPAGIVRLTGRTTPDGRWEFSVEDRGPGLAESVRARLFQPCASTKPGGSGLGLALSQQLAQQAGGRIELVKSDTEGTCFRLVLEPGV
jgi:signal transduction histidine kinase